MSKNKFTKIVSFLLSVPCFTSNNTGAMNFTKNNAYILHKNGYNDNSKSDRVLRSLNLIKSLAKDFMLSVTEFSEYEKQLKSKGFDYSVKWEDSCLFFTIKLKLEEEETFSFEVDTSKKRVDMMFYPNSSQKSCKYTFYYHDKDSSKIKCICKEIFVYDKVKIQDSKTAFNSTKYNFGKKVDHKNSFGHKPSMQNHIPSENESAQLGSQRSEGKNSIIKKFIKLDGLKNKTQNKFYIKNNLFMKKNFNRVEENQSPLIVQLDLYKDEDLSTTDNSLENNKKKYEKRDLSKHKNCNSNIFSNNYSSKQKIDLYSPVVHLGLRGESGHVGFDNAAKSRKIYVKRKITNT